MVRLNLVVEGQTEEAFANRTLKPALAQCGVWLYARSVETSRSNKKRQIFRGGVLDYQKAKRDILRWTKEDRKPDARFSSMFDLYELPDDFPGFTEAAKIRDKRKRVRLLEQKLTIDIGDERFVPYIQLHEFEALLLADASKFEVAFPQHKTQIRELVDVVTMFDSPEDINLGSHTAPSKRIISKIPAYAKQKRSLGPIIAEHIGLQAIRARCPHFEEWLRKLESLEIRSAGGKSLR